MVDSKVWNRGRGKESWSQGIEWGHSGVKWSEEQGSTQLKWEGKQETEEGRKEGVKIRKGKANRDK